MTLLYYLKVAQNLAHGHGSTFNGLVRTNGYQPSVVPGPLRIEIGYAECYGDFGFPRLQRLSCGNCHVFARKIFAPVHRRPAADRLRLGGMGNALLPHSVLLRNGDDADGSDPLRCSVPDAPHGLAGA